MTFPSLASIKTAAPSPMDVDGEEKESGLDIVVVSPTFCASTSASCSAASTPRATWGGAELAATADSLPSDVLWRIATMLPVSDLPSAMAVCSSWKRGFGDAVDALAPGSLSSSSPPSIPAALFLPKRFPHLRSLDLSSVPATAATDAALVEPLRSLTLLERLSLRGCRALTAPGLSRALGSLPRLKWLDLSGCVGLQSRGGSEGGGLAAAMPVPGVTLSCLEAFRADRIPWLSDADVEALARAIYSPRPASSSSSLSPPRRGLAELSLDGAGKLTGGGLAALAPPPSSPRRLSRGLERLSLAGCLSLEDSGLAKGVAPFASSLERLVVDRCPLVTGRGLLSAAMTPSPSSPPRPLVFASLRHLSARASGFDDEGAEAAFSGSVDGGAAAADGGATTAATGPPSRFPSLEELVLDDCASLTDRGVAALAGGGGSGSGATPAGLPRLSRLSLSRLPSVDGSGLEPLLPSAPGVRSLCLSGCVRLSERAARAVSESSVESLDVSDCERVSVGFLSHVGRCPSLRRLKASRCPRLNAAAVRALGGNEEPCALEELEVSGCGALFVASAPSSASADDESERRRRRDSGADAVASSLPNLRSLDVSATSLDEAGLRELLLLASERETEKPTLARPRLPMLSSLNVACCPSLSRAGVERTIRSLPREFAAGCRVNSWGCRRGSTVGGEAEGREEREKAAAAVEAEKKEEKAAAAAVPSRSNPAGPTLSFGHLSPPRGNKAAAAALAAAA